MYAAQQAWLARLEVAWEVEKEAVLNWVTGQQSPGATSALDKAQENQSFSAPAKRDAPFNAMQKEATAQLPKMSAVEGLLMQGSLEAKRNFDVMAQELHAHLAKTPTNPEENVRKEGCSIISVYRTLTPQVSRWTAKFADLDKVKAPTGPYEQLQKDILSTREHGRSVPGMSRHAMGAEFDIGSTTQADWDRKGETFTEKPGKEVKVEKDGQFVPHLDWLEENAWKYGFFRPYKGGKGVAKSIQDKYGDGFVAIVEERWHWSYYPVAQAFWELLNRHRADYEKRLKRVLVKAFPDSPGKDGSIPWHQVSWVADNLRMLHEGINTKL